MAEWKPIEKVASTPIWVLKYDLWQKGGKFVAPHSEGAEKFTFCHGWYASEDDALRVWRHFPRPGDYHIEKVWQRKQL